MGSLTPPQSGSVYLDANCIIYSMEHIAPYDGVLLPMWQSASPGSYVLVTSALSLLETLVGPVKAGDVTLEADYLRLLKGGSEPSGGQYLRRSSGAGRAVARFDQPADARRDPCSHGASRRVRTVYY